MPRWRPPPIILQRESHGIVDGFEHDAQIVLGWRPLFPRNFLDDPRAVGRSRDVGKLPLAARKKDAHALADFSVQVSFQIEDVSQEGF